MRPVSNPVYSEECGACHFTYQPELLPSASWKKVVTAHDDHFGESVRWMMIPKRPFWNILLLMAQRAALRSEQSKSCRVWEVMFHQGLPISHTSKESIAKFH
jgi:hypothetical protein